MNKKIPWKGFVIQSHSLRNPFRVAFMVVQGPQGSHAGRDNPGLGYGSLSGFKYETGDPWLSFVTILWVMTRAPAWGREGTAAWVRKGARNMSSLIYFIATLYFCIVGGLLFSSRTEKEDGWTIFVNKRDKMGCLIVSAFLFAALVLYTIFTGWNE